MLNAPLAPPLAAHLLARIVLRRLGDAPGHEFHGNQWTAFSSARLDHEVHANRVGDTERVMISGFKKESEKTWLDVGPREPVTQFTLDLNHGDKTAYANRIDAKEHKGYGRETLEAALAQAKARGFKSVTTYIEHTNDASQSMVGKLGFTKGKESPTHEGAYYHRTLALRDLKSKDNTPLHQAADAMLPRMRTSVRYAFALAKRQAPDKDNVVSTLHDALVKVLPKTLLAVAEVGGNVALGKLGRLKAAESIETFELRALKPGQKRGSDKPSLEMRFDASDPNAVAWAKEHAAELAKDISDVTRERIADAIAAALEDGEDPRDEILAAVGDEARTELIARTETMRAASEGQRLGWDQATEAGLLNGDEKRVWIATDGCCDDCDELDGEEATLDGSYPGDGGDGPPLHPNCRCTEGLTGEES